MFMPFNKSVQATDRLRAMLRMGMNFIHVPEKSCLEFKILKEHRHVLEKLNSMFHCVKYRNFTNFLVCKFCEKTQFPHSFGRFAQNYAEDVPFHKISIPEN